MRYEVIVEPAFHGNMGTATLILKVPGEPDGFVVSACFAGPKGQSGAVERMQRLCDLANAQLEVEEHLTAALERPGLGEMVRGMGHLVRDKDGNRCLIKVEDGRLRVETTTLPAYGVPAMGKTLGVLLKLQRIKEAEREEAVKAQPSLDATWRDKPPLL